MGCAQVAHPKPSWQAERCRQQSAGKHNYTAITQLFLRLLPSAATLQGPWISTCRVTCAETPSLLVSKPHPPGPVIGGTRAPCRIWPTKVALRECSWAAPPRLCHERLQVGPSKGTRCQTFNTSTQGFGKPDAFYVFKFDTPKPQTSSARSIFERSTSRSWTCGTSSDAVTMALDAGASVRIREDLQFFEDFGAKFAAIFRSRHGGARHVYYSRWVGLGSDFGT